MSLSYEGASFNVFSFGLKENIFHISCDLIELFVPVEYIYIYIYIWREREREIILTLLMYRQFLLLLFFF